MYDDGSHIYGQVHKLLSSLIDFSNELDINLLNSNRIIDIYVKLFKNLELLQVAKNKLLRYHILMYKFMANHENYNEYKHDIYSYKSFIRSRQLTRKANIDRIRCAIASHKIAIGHINENYGVRCSNQKCRFSSRLEVFLKTNKCPKCGSLLNIIENPKSVSRIDIIKYLPYSGNYLDVVTKFNPYQRWAYSEILRLLKLEERKVFTSASIILKIIENGRAIRKRIKVELERKDFRLCEEKITELFGQNARIEKIMWHKSKPILINDKYVRQSLAIAYVRFADVLLSKYNITIKDIYKEFPIYLISYDLSLFLLMKTEYERSTSIGPFPHMMSRPSINQIKKLTSVLKWSDVAIIASNLGICKQKLTQQSIVLKEIMEKLLKGSSSIFGIVSSTAIAAALVYLTSNLSLSHVSDMFNESIATVMNALTRLKIYGIEKYLTEEQRSKLNVVPEAESERAKLFLKKLMS